MEGPNEPGKPARLDDFIIATEDQLSSLLKVCKRQLYNWRMRGEIPYFKLGRVVRYRVGDVVEALKRMRVT